MKRIGRKRKGPYSLARKKIRRAVEIVMETYENDIQTLDDIESVIGCIKTQLHGFTGVHIVEVEYDRIREQMVITANMPGGRSFPTRVLVGRWIKNTPIRRYDFEF